MWGRTGAHSSPGFPPDMKTPSRAAATLPVALDADARWIWGSGVTGPNSYAELRRAFTLRSVPQTAYLQVSAETSLRLWINGELAYCGPPREVSPYFYFDTVDLRPRLRPGENELRIVAHHQGENSASYQAGTPAILVAGCCRDGEAGGIRFAEADGWQVRRIGRYRPGAPRLFSCLGFSEHVDFSAPDGPWEEAVEVARHPWQERPHALARDLPEFRESIRHPRESRPLDGGTLIDFGEEVSGFVRLTMRAARAFSLNIAYAERLSGGRVDAFKGGMRYADRLEVPAGTAAWLSYEKRAFRYLHVSEPLAECRAEVIEMEYPYDPVYRGAGDYQRRRRTPRGRLINRILDVSARTIALNSEDLLTDCPWRERAQYFDCNFYMGAMQRLFGTLAPVRRFLHQFPRGADESGLLRMAYPSPKETLVIPDFSISYAGLLWRYLELGGDWETVLRNLSFAERGVTAFRAHEDHDGLLTDVPGWIFLDNTFELPKFPRSAALNAVYCGAHHVLAELFQAKGDAEAAARFSARFAELRSAFRRTFLRGDRLLDCDATPLHEQFRHWVYFHGGGTRPGAGGSFRLRTAYRLAQPGAGLRLAVHAGGRAWIDGVSAATIEAGGSWLKSAIYQPAPLAAPGDTDWHLLDLEVEKNGIDWECYLSSRGDVEWADTLVWEEENFGRCCIESAVPADAEAAPLRRHLLPWMSQITVGYAACNGLLEPGEARRFLRECLPAQYPFAFARRTTPVFATIGDTPGGKRILPCNVPASMFYFCTALRRYGMVREARKLLLDIYQAMLERDATTWWEEWNERSSCCHAWGSFVAEFF